MIVSAFLQNKHCSACFPHLLRIAFCLCFHLREGSDFNHLKRHQHRLWNQPALLAISAEWALQPLFIKLRRCNQIKEQVLRPPVGSSVGAHRAAGSDDIKTEQT